MAATLVKEGAFFGRVWKSLRGLFVKVKKNKKKYLKERVMTQGGGNNVVMAILVGLGRLCLFINHLEFRK